jgi:glutathione S-transferase
MSLVPTPPEPTFLACLKGGADAAYGVVYTHLRSYAYLVGSAPRIADFSLCGYAFYPIEESGFDVPIRYPNIAAWLDRLRAIPGWAPPYDILPGERIAPKW